MVALMLGAQDLEPRHNWLPDDASLTPSAWQLAADSGQFGYSSDLRLLSAIPHELRAPLTLLVTSSELLAESIDTSDQPHVQRLVTSLHRGALWLQSLVENLLCVATIREGRFPVRPEPVLLLDVLAEIQPMIEPLLACKRQRLSVRSNGPPSNVVADGRRIGQVLINLILNASKFAPDATTIGLTITTEPRRVRIVVTDRGPGIRPKDVERLFEPYYQGALGVASSKGIGVGLAIAQVIVQAHGGSIGARNRRGGGACFWFELPQASAVAADRSGR